MSLGCTSIVRHDINIDTTSPIVPIAPSTIPGPNVGTHESRSTRRLRRPAGVISCVLAMTSLQFGHSGQEVYPEGGT